MISGRRCNWMPANIFGLLIDNLPPFRRPLAIPDRVRRIQICLSICSLIGSTDPTSAQEIMYGLRYCAPPTVPKCIDMKETYDHAPTVALCEAEVSRYVLTAVSYRDCLLRESQRAILQANKAIDRLKCATKAACCDHPESCP